MIEVSAKDLDLLRGIFSKHLPGVEVWVFGSRLNGPTKPSSDLDLALYSEKDLSFKVMGALEDALSEAPLPYRVDCVDVSKITPEFRAIIERSRARIF
jgi:predicted nucleotidyltransferase